MTLPGLYSVVVAVAVDGAGNVYPMDTNYGWVQEIPLATTPSLSFADTSLGDTSP